MTSDKRKVARRQQVGRQAGVNSLLKQNLHTSGKFACPIKFQLQCSSIFTGYLTISAESFPFLPEIFFVKGCIEEITRFVAAVN